MNGALRPAPRPALRLDFVSPLPPVRSGIADYSVDLLPALMTRADVRVLGLPGQPVDSEVAARFDVVPAAGAADDGRLALYQMGNNRHHDPVEALALRRPGVLTLHDVVLHHLLSEQTLGLRDFAAYRERLAADHGWVGAAAARPRLWGGHVEALLFELPAHRTLLCRQRGVLVHSEWAARTLEDEIPGLRVAAVPMGIPLPPPVDSGLGHEFRRRFAIPDQAPLIGSFGFQTPIKRTDRVVGALAAPGLSAVHLVIVGESPAGASLIELARELGVADRVHETGFVTFEDFEAGIAAADLALNLRYPSAGETSASLLRVLAVGRPAIVSEFAQFAELPDEVALKVPVGEGEIEGLVARLTEFLAAPEALARMGAAAREHVRREHDPERAAAAVVDRCQEWREAEPLGPISADPPAPTSFLSRSLSATIAVEGAERPWPPGERRRLRATLRNSGPVRLLAAERGAGGIALEVALVSPGGDPDLGRPWLPLPRDLAAGESHTFELDVRRPLGEAALRLIPQVAGRQRLVDLEGPLWEGDL
jgi:glycosyltransferase involved in cell wall biosynthesis